MIMRRFLFSAVVGLALISGAVLPAFAATNPEALPSLAPMLSKVESGVVNISVRGTIREEENPLLQDPFFRRFFNLPEQQPMERQVQSVGSGVIIDAKDGYVVTNNHVVDNAEEIEVILSDRRQVDAKVVGTDPDSDIAVLKIKGDGYSAVPMGDSDQLKVGDFVVAIGNPFGVGQTATLGIVSALGRTGLGIEGYEDFIQTDASINPGNSGGALVDQSGHLVGINTAIVSRTGGSVGIGFAIPVNMVRQIADQLIKHGKVTRGQLGVLVQDVTPDIAEAMGAAGTEGAVISQVASGSPAEKAGLKASDIITAVNGKSVKSAADLRNTVGFMHPGEKVDLDVVRDGKHMTIGATLGEVKKTEAEAEGKGAQLRDVVLSEIPPGHPLYGQVQGVLVQEIKLGSKAARAGLRPGDVIVAINRTPVTTPDEAYRLLRERGDKPALLDVRRGDEALFVAIR
jgi:serine protease Do/serine protease DegQ